MPGISLFRHAEEYEDVAAGTRIFAQGEPGDAMYAIKSGQVDIVVADRVVDTLGPDEIFGEMALIDAVPRSASAVARTDAQIVRITESRFKFLVQQTPFLPSK